MLCLARYGSVVFFNTSEKQQQEMLQLAQTYAELPNPVDTPTSSSGDSYRIEVHDIPLSDNPEEWCRFDPDRLRMRYFDLNSCRVVSQVLAQSVALEYNENKVRGMLDHFRSVNFMLERTGKVSMPATDLFKLVAMNNNIMADVLTQLKLLDRCVFARVRACGVWCVVCGVCCVLNLVSCILCVV